MKEKTLTVFYLAAIISGGGLAASCSLTATRPNQEMSNAEVALKAAKDLNADSLVPEIYRAAQENYFKAKRDYRLKDFENAHTHALRATRLAEQAEFEAYRMGGATPELSNKAPEGGSPDADAAFKDAGAPPEAAPPPEGAKPGGPAGPQPPSGPSGPPQKQNFKTTTPDTVPATGGVPPDSGAGYSAPVTGNANVGDTSGRSGSAGNARGTGQSTQSDITPNKGVTIDDMRSAETPDKVGGPITQFTGTPMAPVNDGKGAIPEMGTQGNKPQDGFDQMQGKPLPAIKSKPMGALGDTQKDEDEDGTK